MGDTGDEKDLLSSGSARFGNFINYYSFNPAENRIKLLPDYTQYISNNKNNVVCLDIGCNVGELTQALQKHLEKNVMKSSENKDPLNCYILAVDMDRDLIERANSANQNQLITFSCADVLSSDFRELCDLYLKQHDRQQFDVVYCFSITMWIHMNHGDEGLKHFLVLLSKLADLLVIEPQPWKCYNKAVRRLKRLNSEPFKNFEGLKIRKNVESYIATVLTKECNFKQVVVTAPTNWGRVVKFFKKKIV